MFGYFSSFRDVITMSGYGKYVWVAFGAVIGSLFGYSFLSLQQLRRLIEQENAEKAETSDLYSS